MLSKTVLVSIHPEHVAKILSGTKCLEFRRMWAAHPVDRLLIYSTVPMQQLVAVANIKQTIIGSPNALWKSAQTLHGGITRRRLFDYLHGKRSAVALELSNVRAFERSISLAAIFRGPFRAPQSFRYLKTGEEARLNKLIITKTCGTDRIGSVE